MTTAFYTDERSHIHTLPGHPEHAGRLKAVLQQLDETGLRTQMQAINGQPAPRQDLERVHHPRYLDLLERTTQMGEPVMLGPDTYLMPESYELAQLAAGGTMAVAEAIVTGEADNGLVTARPPGHHATPTQGMGFCLINNVAMAARHIQSLSDVEHVAIVDFDVHHGNGTQDIFYADDSVLFISSHQSPLYPGTGAFNDRGRGAGEGYTLNLPVLPHTGDEALVTLYREIVIPALERYQPEFIIVSAGFDGHWRDPLAQLELSVTGFATLTHMLYDAAQTICDGKIMFVMEGGYDLDALSHGVSNVARCLLGLNDMTDPIGHSRKEKPLGDGLVERLRAAHPLFD